MRPSETTLSDVIPLATNPILQRSFKIRLEPIPGNLRFGVLLEHLDILAARAALGYVGHFDPSTFVVTAAVDEIVVRQVPDVARDLRCSARVNHVSHSSMEVGIRIESISTPSSAGAPTEHLASAYFTLVARRGDGARSTAVTLPPLELEDDLEKIRSERAVRRREAWRRAAQAEFDPPTPEEFVTLRDLHRAQASPSWGGLRASNLVTETWERTFPSQEANPKIIFGGYVMNRAYELSLLCAERVTTLRPILAAVNRINFFHPVPIGHKLHMTSRVVHTSGPAICVETGIERISPDNTVRDLSNSCLFTFVAVDERLEPRDVPVVAPANYAEDARLLQARRHLAELSARVGRTWLPAALQAGTTSPPAP